MPNAGCPPLLTRSVSLPPSASIDERRGHGRNLAGIQRLPDRILIHVDMNLRSGAHDVNRVGAAAACHDRQRQRGGAGDIARRPWTAAGDRADAIRILPGRLQPCIVKTVDVRRYGRQPR